MLKINYYNYNKFIGFFYLLILNKNIILKKTKKTLLSPA